VSYFVVEHLEIELRNMNRRNFIRESGAIISGATLIGSSGFTMGKVKKYKMGLQLFTVRDAMSRDAAGTLKIISSLQYEDLETYGYDAERNYYYGFKAADFRKKLEDNQLTTTTGHYDLFLYVDKPLDSLKHYVDQCITGAQALGQKYITWPWLDPQSRTIDKFKVVAERLNIIGEQVGKAGLGLAYHNHDFEFIDHAGKNGYDIIMSETDASLVKLQIDLYWAVHSSKLTPHELFTKQPGRFVMWHIKDMDKKTRDYTELGNGSIDYIPILPDASLAGLEYYFIEQGGNFFKDSIQSITDSAAFMKKNLEKFLY
jgi:sugar phosphate isomerase/epimerase